MLLNMLVVDLTEYCFGEESIFFSFPHCGERILICCFLKSEIDFSFFNTASFLKSFT